MKQAAAAATIYVALAGCGTTLPLPADTASSGPTPLELGFHEREWCLQNIADLLAAYEAAGGPALPDGESERLQHFFYALEGGDDVLRSPPALTDEHRLFARQACRIAFQLRELR